VNIGVGPFMDQSLGLEYSWDYAQSSTNPF